MDAAALTPRTRLKRWFKQVVAEVSAPARKPGVIILVYHKVGSALPAEMNVPLPEFRRQMTYLTSHYPVWPLERALRTAQDGRLDRDVVVLTFDDGYQYVYTHAYPLLREHSLPATVYVCPEYVRRGCPMPWDRERSERVMDWATLRDLTADGLVQCGSHTWSHRVLPGAPDAEIANELARSQREIADRLGAPVRDFCYPKSLWDRRCARLVGRWYATAAVGGYRKAVPPVNPLCLYRIPVVLSDTFELFVAKLDGRLRGEAALGWPRSVCCRVTGRWPLH